MVDNGVLQNEDWNLADRVLSDLMKGKYIRMHCFKHGEKAWTFWIVSFCGNAHGFVGKSQFSAGS